MENPYQPPTSFGEQNTTPSNETPKAMRNRHWVESFNAKKPVIKPVPMTILIVILGMVILYFVSFVVRGSLIFLGSFALAGAIIWVIDSSLTAARLSKVLDRHKKELDSLVTPMADAQIEE